MQHILLAFLFLLLLLHCAAPTIRAAAPLQVFTDDASIKVATVDGDTVLSIGPAIWGPNWGWTGLKIAYRLKSGGALGSIMMAYARVLPSP